VGFVGGETGYCSETCVTGGVGGTGEGSVGGEWAIDIKEEVSSTFEEMVDIKEEVCIKVEEDLDIKEECIKIEEAVDVKEEMPEDIVFPPIKTEPEVRLWGVGRFCVSGGDSSRLIVSGSPCICVTTWCIAVCVCSTCL
jgi:hypothetical protein